MSAILIHLLLVFPYAQLLYNTRESRECRVEWSMGSRLLADAGEVRRLWRSGNGHVEKFGGTCGICRAGVGGLRNNARVLKHFSENVVVTVLL